ncbi:MAG: hypothetical protein COB67_05860 [SAR324 cluster bacterium]|uniref:Tyr recombinase domain-containing protein n=1 Tax=SAR324 cluster bacterium TaxID=2024889 RepID=A0A2A4T4U2_9DELT|nr:MAG: hypothetical protein COB67_05860 [SAR324 cluster bacterium]
MKFLKGKSLAQQKINLINRLLKFKCKKSETTHGCIHSIATLKIRNTVFNMLVEFLIQEGFSKTLTEITEELLIKFLQRRLDQGLSSRSLINNLSTISACFTALKKQGIFIKICDFTTARYFCKNNGKKIVKKNRAVKKINIDKLEHIEVKIIANMQFETGFRIDEIYQIKSAKIKKYGNKYFVQKGSIQGKGGKRLVAKEITANTANFYLEMLKINNDKIPISKVTYSKYFKLAFGDTSHSCRYNFAQYLSNFLNNKRLNWVEKKRIIARELGHVRISSANHYAY